MSVTNWTCPLFIRSYSYIFSVFLICLIIYTFFMEKKKNKEKRMNKKSGSGWRRVLCVRLTGHIRDGFASYHPHIWVGYEGLRTVRVYMDDTKVRLGHFFPSLFYSVTAEGGRPRTYEELFKKSGCRCSQIRSLMNEWLLVNFSEKITTWKTLNSNLYLDPILLFAHRKTHKSFLLETSHMSTV